MTQPAYAPHEAEPLLPRAALESEDYRLLTGHPRTDGSYKTDDQLRAEYVQRTDELIRLMTEGVAVSDPETHETTMEKPDYVIWLDKSARPVAWLTKELWPKLAPAPGEPVPPMPQFRFVNIDREQWVTTIDPHGSGDVDIDLVDKSIIRSLRSVFVSPKDKREGLTDKIDTVPAELDGKTVLIIDEVISTGKTIQIANSFFKRAFPTARIATSYWMGGQTQIGLSKGNADLPVWYVEKSEQGRGVANREERLSQKSSSLTQQLGSWFLSTRFPELDPSSQRLRAELHKLATDEEVLVVPSNQRNIDDYVERAEALNGLEFEAFLDKKRELSAQQKPKN